jgi:peptidoglycan/LPS O-acetylase OafA/YrhL
MQLQKNTGEEFANLDLLRSVAVLSVFFSHLIEIVTRHETEMTWHIGQIGVLIFFVHTSLVLMQSMERLGLQGRALFSTFYVRRWFRIYPLSIFCVLIAYAFSASPRLEPVVRTWNMKELLANLSLTQDLFYKAPMVGGLWTLPLEVQMYVALPVLFVVFRNRPLVRLFALWAATIPIAMLQPRVSGRLDVIGFVPCFLGGVIAWRISHLYGPKLPGWLWPFGFAAISTVWMSASREHNMLYRWAFCLVLGCAIPWFYQMGWTWLTVPAKLVARYSYGIYLSHIALMMLCFRQPTWPSKPALWAAFVALAVGTPIAIYHLLEHPMIGVGRKLTSRRSTRPLTIEPVTQEKVL